MKKRTRGKSVILFVCCFLLFLGAVFALFAYYWDRLNDEFGLLVQENLTAYADSQKREVGALFADLQGTLEAIAVLIDTSGQDPEGPWLQEYLQTLGERNAKYHVTYASIAYLTQNLDASNATENDHDALKLLKEGQPVVSDLRLSQRLGNRYYFSVAVPVVQGGTVTGALRSISSADVLTQNAQTGYLRQSITSFLVRSDGTMITLEKDTALPDNLFAEMETRNVARQTIDELRSAAAEHRSISRKVGLSPGESAVVSLSYLGHHDWYLLNVARSGDVAVHSQAIMKETIQISVSLAVLMALIGLLIFLVLQRQRRKLDLEHARYAILSNFSDTVLFEYSFQADTLEFTSNARRIFHLQSLRVEQFKKDQYLTGRVHPEDYRQFGEQMAVLPPAGETGSREIRIKEPGAPYKWYLCQYQAVYQEGRKNPVMLVGKLVDISGQKEKEKGLLERATMDELTGLKNKAAVEGQMEQYLKKQIPGYFLMIDIDNFKTVNDQWGHMAGDRLLQNMGKLLDSVFRESDLKGRVGGDEFAVFMAGCKKKEAAGNKAAQLLKQLMELAGRELGDNEISLSVGIARAPEHGITYGALFKAADTAMYEAKNAGKNRVCFYKNKKIEEQ